jgi:hypothetical protein
MKLSEVARKLKFKEGDKVRLAAAKGDDVHVVKYNKSTDPLYHRDEYPYKIKYASGFEEVYSEDELRPA